MEKSSIWHKKKYCNHLVLFLFGLLPSSFQQVCHNWSDEECIKLLRNCHKALPEEGKVIIIEYIIPEVPDSSLISKNTCIADNLMFAVTSGKERTEKEFDKLCRNSGFSRFHVACSDLSVTSRVMEFYK